MLTRPAGQARRIGRVPDNDIVVPHPSVSRHHAELHATPGGYRIVDLGSHNGTFVNEQRVSAATLAEGDTIGFGDTTFRLSGGELTMALAEAMRRLTAAGLLPERAGQPVKAWAHISLADLMLLATVTLWGLNFTVTKYVISHGFEPIAYGVLRFGSAALVFGAFTWWRERSFAHGRRDLAMLTGAAKVPWMMMPSLAATDRRPVMMNSRGDNAPIWSPDSKKLLWSDRLQRLRYVDVASKAVTLVDQDKFGEIQGYNWSPDSQWITWARPEENDMPRVYLYSLANKQQTAVTDSWYGSGEPVFSDDGKYLLLASARDFKPTFGDQEFANVYRDMQRVYLVTLAKETANPLAPKSDEVGKAAEKREKEKAKQAEEKKPEASPGEKKPEEKSKKPVVVKVDTDGIQNRIVGLEITPGNYRNIRMLDDNRIFYLRRTAGDDVGEDDEELFSEKDKKSHLCAYNLDDRKETVIGDVNNYQITFDGKKMLVKIKKDYAIIDIPKDKIETKDHEHKIQGLDMQLDRRAEWRQIYFECWRQMRDFFFSPTMDGMDWKAMRDKYAALLPFVNNRNDLTYLLGELIGELNIGHSYVGSGERPDTPRIKLGLLGAELSRDPATRAYRIERILPGENWDKKTRSPLTDIGVNVKPGDYILAINNTPVSSLPNLYDALIGAAGKQVILRVNSKPTDDGARDVTVVPTDDEAPLYYIDWVQKNIDYVTKKTGGEVGYLHIPDMGQPGLNEFTKLYFPQIRKHALIVDVRGNGGGFVSPLVIERLRRALVMIGIARNGMPQTDPSQTFTGPMVTLINEFSASDGDIFPYRFKSLGLGKLIGKRTWGGVTGIRESLPLVDGGQFFKPEFALYSKDGKQWIVEGHGVDPDIVVDNDPGKEFKGEDQQLDRAIQEMQDGLKTKGTNLPSPPPWPNRNPAGGT